jgi:hypothetical protein
MSNGTVQHNEQFKVVSTTGTWSANAGASAYVELTSLIPTGYIPISATLVSTTAGNTPVFTPPLNPTFFPNFNGLSAWCLRIQNLTSGAMSVSGTLYVLCVRIDVS